MFRRQPQRLAFFENKLIRSKDVGPGFALRPYVPPCLDPRDIANLKQHFPMLADDGSPNWALTGGAAVCVLRAALETDGKPMANPPETDERFHKDLDIVAFRPENARGMEIVHPHEIYRTFGFGRYQRCRYDERNPLMQGFHIEILSGFYFGFPFPQSRETVRIVCEPDGRRETFVVLSPAYLFANRLFHMMPPRENDPEDIGAIMARHQIRAEDVRRIVDRSPMRGLPPETIADVIASKGKNSDGVNRFAVSRARERFPWLKSCDDHLIARNLLPFYPDEIDERTFREALRLSATIAPQTFADAKLRSRVNFGLAMCLYPNLGVSGHVHIRRLGYACSDSGANHITAYMAMCSEYLRGMICLRRGMRQTGYLDAWPAVSLQILRRFLNTVYRNVLLAELNVTAKELETIGDRERFTRVLGPLLAFAGWRTWEKEFSR